MMLKWQIPCASVDDKLRFQHYLSEKDDRTDER